MVVLRADPWMPAFGMGFQVAAEEAPSAADPSVESEDWSEPRTVRDPAPLSALCFVDGVRRVDLRLIAEADGGRRVPGLLGSFAVGAVRCDGRAAFADHEVARAVILAGGLSPDPIQIGSSPGGRLTFEPSSVTGEEPDAPLHGLQDLMRRREGLLAARMAAEDGVVVLADGPLAFFDSTVAPVVGVVKQTMCRYLGGELEGLIPKLGPGQRTPLFGLGEDDRLRRYSWYTRLVALRAPWHDRAGIVRCEVRAGVGLEAAIAVADRVSGFMPSYAGRPSDPRAPQNLAPVGALESWLRHRMGHPHIVRRSLLHHLASEAAA